MAILRNAGIVTRGRNCLYQIASSKTDPFFLSSLFVKFPRQSERRTTPPVDAAVYSLGIARAH